MVHRTATDEDRLIKKWIEPDPRKPGVEEARITRYGVNVWAIIGCRGTEDGNPVDVANGYKIPVEAVEAAIAYYRRHKACIDVRIRANSGERVEVGDDPLVRKHITLDPDWDSEDDARIKGYGMNVWALIGAYRGAGEDIDEVARSYRIPVEVVEAALRYYRLHKDAIDCRLAAHLA